MRYAATIFAIALVCATSAFSSGAMGDAVGMTGAASADGNAAGNAAGGVVPAESTGDVPEASGADSSFRFSHDNVFTVMGVVMTHHALRNSETLHNWPFFAVAAPAVSTTYKFEKDFGKTLTVKGDAMGSLTFMNTGVTAGVDLLLIHLLELGVHGAISSAWNYGETSTFMGVYDSGERNFDEDIFLTEASFSVIYKSSITIPLLAFLPKSNWTKIILKFSGSLENSVYTGADDGELWRAGADARVNGYRGELGASIMYMLPFKHFHMAMLTGKVSGFLHDGDFDEEFQDYDPDFKIFNITPMLMFKINEKWSGMAMAPIVRERKLSKSKYEAGEEYMLKRVGSQWRMNVLMCMFNRKF